MNEGRQGGKKAWLNILLFGLTVISVFIVGLGLSLNYVYAEAGGEGIQSEPRFESFFEPRVVRLSVVYAVVLLTILMGHELGHYLMCRRYGIDATLPFFIPAPTFIGTLGAFIKIRSPITRKNELFDIGAAGPITGFLLSLPALIYGISLSKVLPPLSQEGTLYFGEPLILKIIGGLVLKDVPAGYDLYLHPVAFAGWVGILVTAFNLFPIGQLDGGHVLYSLLGKRSKPVSLVVLAFFIIMGVFFWLGWVVWACVILILGLKHPRVLDEMDRISAGRRFVGLAVIIIFLISFTPFPVKGYSLLALINGWGR